MAHIEYGNSSKILWKVLFAFSYFLLFASCIACSYSNFALWFDVVILSVEEQLTTKKDKISWDQKVKEMNKKVDERGHFMDRRTIFWFKNF